MAKAPNLENANVQNVDLFGGLSNALGANGGIARALVASDEAARLKIEQERQAKADARADLLFNQQQTERDASQYMMGELAKGRQVADSATMWNATDKQPTRWDAIAFAPTDTPEQTALKTKQQAELARIATNPTSAMMETRSQQLGRVMEAAGGKYGGYIPASMYDKYDNALLQDVVAQQAKDKELAAEIKGLRKEDSHTALEMAKLGAKATGGSSGGITLNDNGTFSYGGGSGINKVATAQLKGALKTANANEQANADIAKEIGEGITKSKLNVTAEDKTSMVANTQKNYDALLRAGADPEAAKTYALANAAGSLKKDYPIYQFWGKNYAIGDSKLPAEVLDRAEAAGKHRADLEKLQLLQMASGGKGSVDMSTYNNLAKTLIVDNEKEIAKLTAERALAKLSPEERQYNALNSQLSSLLAPKVAAPAKTDAVTKAVAGSVNGGGKEGGKVLPKPTPSIVPVEESTAVEQQRLLNKAGVTPTVEERVAAKKQIAAQSDYEKNAYKYANIPAEVQGINSEAFLPTPTEYSLLKSIDGVKGQKIDMRLASTMKDLGLSGTAADAIAIANSTNNEQLKEVLFKYAQDRQLESGDPEYRKAYGDAQLRDAALSVGTTLAGTAAGPLIGKVAGSILGKAVPTTKQLTDSEVLSRVLKYPNMRAKFTQVMESPRLDITGRPVLNPTSKP